MGHGWRLLVHAPTNRGSGSLQINRLDWRATDSFCNRFQPLYSKAMKLFRDFCCSITWCWCCRARRRGSISVVAILLTWRIFHEAIIHFLKDLSATFVTILERTRNRLNGSHHPRIPLTCSITNIIVVADWVYSSENGKNRSIKGASKILIIILRIENTMSRLLIIIIAMLLMSSTSAYYFYGSYCYPQPSYRYNTYRYWWYLYASKVFKGFAIAFSDYLSMLRNFRRTSLEDVPTNNRKKSRFFSMNALHPQSKTQKHTTLEDPCREHSEIAES